MAALTMASAASIEPTRPLVSTIPRAVGFMNVRVLVARRECRARTSGDAASEECIAARDNLNRGERAVSFAGASSALVRHLRVASAKVCARRRALAERSERLHARARTRLG